MLQEVKDKFYGGPFRKGRLHVYPFELVIAVTSNAPMSDPGNLQRVSPEEPEHAFLLWIAELLDTGVTDNDRLQIKRLLLSMPLKFVVLASEEARYFHQANMREQIAMRHEIESRTAVQKIYEFQMLRTKKNWKAKDIADRYTKEVEQAPRPQAEQVSLKYIENCFHIWDALFTIPDVQAVILDMERRHGMKSPFHFMSQLLALEMKCKSAETAFWAVSFMRLYIDRGLMTHGEMTFRNLTGRNTNQKGWLDVIIEKKAVLAWLQGPFVEKLELAESEKVLIRSITSAETAERFFATDQGWKAACRAEAVSLLDFIWKVVFGAKHDGQLKNLLKQSRTPEELMGVAPFADDIQAIKDEAEQKKEEEATPRAAVTAGVHPDGDADDGGYTELVHNMCTAEDIEKDKDNALSAWMEKADNLVRKFIHLTVDCNSQTEISEALKNMAVVKMMGQDNKRIGVFYACQHAGESDSMPHCRIPAFRLDHLQKTIGGTIKAAGLDALPPGAVYFILNGGSFGNNDAFGKAFLDVNNKAMAKNKDLVYLALQEESLQKRRLRKRGGLNLMQGVVIFTPPSMELIQGSSHTAERLHFTSTTPNSNIISGISVESYEDLWLLEPAVKKRIMKDGLVRAGGSCPEHLREDKPEISGKGSKVPLSWHSLPHQLWEEFFHSYELDGGVFLTLLDDQPAVAAIRCQKQAVGLTLNSAHMEMMYARLAGVVFQAFRDPSDDLYEPALGKLLGVKPKSKKTTVEEEEDDDEEDLEEPEEDEADDDEGDLEEDEGLGTESFALKDLGIDHRLILCAEKEPHLRKFLKDHHQPKVLVKDVRDSSFMEHGSGAQLLVAGFPCQPFSRQGSNRGVRDPRGDIASHLLKWVDAHRPDSFVLENVTNLMKHKKTFKRILRDLKAIPSRKTTMTGKRKHVGCNSRESSGKHGGKKDGRVDYVMLLSAFLRDQATNRPRLFIVGIAKSKLKRKFHFPKPGTCTSLKSSLSTSKTAATASGKLSATGQRNLAVAEAKWKKKGLDMWSKYIAVDIAASPSRPNSMNNNCLPCLTSCRASWGPPFITKLGRQLSTNELLRAQGFDPKIVGCNSHLSKRQLGAAIGNAITLPVLKQILAKIFQAMS
ncbi:bsp6IM [Symbiodinium sp. CCMP2592]|nr:bsp6IM [Symbiodinium sp. CCMP2592]